MTYVKISQELTDSPAFRSLSWNAGNLLLRLLCHPLLKSFGVIRASPGSLEDDLDEALAKDEITRCLDELMTAGFLEWERGCIALRLDLMEKPNPNQIKHWGRHLDEQRPCEVFTRRCRELVERVLERARADAGGGAQWIEALPEQLAEFMPSKSAQSPAELLESNPSRNPSRNPFENPSHKGCQDPLGKASPATRGSSADVGEDTGADVHWNELLPEQVANDATSNAEEPPAEVVATCSRGLETAALGPEAKGSRNPSRKGSRKTLRNSSLSSLSSILSSQESAAEAGAGGVARPDNDNTTGPPLAAPDVGQRRRDMQRPRFDHLAAAVLGRKRLRSRDQKILSQLRREFGDEADAAGEWVLVRYLAEGKETPTSLGLVRSVLEGGGRDSDVLTDDSVEDFRCFLAAKLGQVEHPFGERLRRLLPRLGAPGLQGLSKGLNRYLQQLHLSQEKAS